MNKKEFLGCYQEKLTEFICMSRTAGHRADYVQGGGGNTSVKLDDRLMAVKASGFRLEQIDLEDAYALLDYAQIRKFYNDNKPEDLADVESQGAAAARSSLVEVTGLKNPRPSVEAGFHAVLDDFVLHTHSVYANLAACSREGEQIAAAALADLPTGHIFVPYVNPGAGLTFTINRRRQQAAAGGSLAGIIFMQNHGLVITGSDAEDCLDLHEQVNRRLAAAFGLDFSAWPQISLEAAGAQEKHSYVSATGWLRERLKNGRWELENFTKEALYPDQLVFLTGQLHAADNDAEAIRLIGGNDLAGAVIARESGRVYYRCGFIEARTIEETLCAVLLVRETLVRTGHNIRFMSEEAKGFISNWESEKYRRKIAAE